MKDKTRRIFIALDISAEAREKAADHIEKLKNKFPDLRVGWEKPEKLHLTLKFLGATTEDQLKNISENLNPAASRIAPFELQITQPNSFGTKILFFTVENKTGELSRLQKEIEQIYVKNNFPVENREYQPHLTIARVREPRWAKNLIVEHRQMKFEPVNFAVSEIIIYESVLQKNGSKYHAIEKIPLKNTTDN